MFFFQSESPSIAELNYSKDSFRLPIELISSSCSEVSDFMSTDTKEDALTNDISHHDDCIGPKSFADHDNDELSNKLHNSMPTPSGSMDSLSSNSHSSSNSSPPLSFTTFGKDKIKKDTDVNGKKSIIFIDDLAQLENNNIQKRAKSIETMESIKVVIGSSDDDSGFENVKCEAK
jgi:hypothetical protein